MKRNLMKRNLMKRNLMKCTLLCLLLSAADFCRAKSPSADTTSYTML